jgi:Na+-driven multidrug efflux pump
LLDSAVDYVKIRSLSMPTSLLLGVVQSALLGAKDSVTPLMAVLYSTIVNVVGDYLLVEKFQLGIRGAAIATLLAQWAATAALLGPARKRLVRDGSLGLGIRSKTKGKVTRRSSNDDDAVSSKSFLGFAAPVLTLILGKLAAFGFMTHSAAAVPGQPTPLASHQIILSLFFFVSPFMEVISQTAQTFLPPYLAPVNDYIAQKKAKNPDYDPESDRKLLKPWLSASFSVGNNLLQLGLVMASIVASLASLVPARFGNLLTSNMPVQEAAKPLAKYLWAGAWLTAPVAVSEGILLARRELKFLAIVYVASTALLPPALIRVKNMGGNVEQVWACFAAFQLFRAFCFVGRIWSGSMMQAIGGAVGTGGEGDEKMKTEKIA